MGTGSFSGVKRPGRGADHPPPSKRRSYERVGLYLYSPSGPSWSVIGRTITFTFATCFGVLHTLDHHEELRILVQNCQLFTSLLRKVY